jgi:hypothetical protein
VPVSRNLGTLTSWNPLGLSRPVTGLLYLLYRTYNQLGNQLLNKDSTPWSSSGTMRPRREELRELARSTAVANLLPSSKFPPPTPKFPSHLYPHTKTQNHSVYTLIGSDKHLTIQTKDERLKLSYLTHLTGIIRLCLWIILKTILNSESNKLCFYLKLQVKI